MKGTNHNIASHFAIEIEQRGRKHYGRGQEMELNVRVAGRFSINPPPPPLVGKKNSSIIFVDITVL